MNNQKHKTRHGDSDQIKEENGIKGTIAVDNEAVTLAFDNYERRHAPTAMPTLSTELEQTDPMHQQRRKNSRIAQFKQSKGPRRKMLDSFSRLPSEVIEQ